MSSAIKIFVPAIISFICGMLMTPILTHYFYKYKLWRKTSRNEVAPDENFRKINGKEELSTPRTGGMIVWMSVIFTIFILIILSFFIDKEISDRLNFLSRSETILPFFALIFASMFGLLDDFIQIYGFKNLTGDPIILRYIKIGTILLIAFIFAWWFYFKLGMTSVYIPFTGPLFLGILFIPFFIMVMLAVFSSSVIDGLDGLSGGVLASIFVAYTVIAFFNGQVDLAAFCAVVVSGILAFLWFNIPPARFYMGESGIIGLTVTISIIAFLTNTVLLLPVIAFPLFITSVSVIVQIISNKLLKGKKIFLVAPLHHHFEALGWPKYKVTMRYWIISIITSIIGVVLAILQ